MIVTILRRPTNLKHYVNTSAKVHRLGSDSLIRSWVVFGDETDIKVSFCESDPLIVGDQVDVTLVSLHSCLQFAGTVKSVSNLEAVIEVPETVRSGPPTEPHRRRGIHATGRALEESGIFSCIELVDIGPKGCGLNCQKTFVPNQQLNVSLVPDVGLIEFKARVVYCTKNESCESEFHYRVGLEIVDFPASDELKWKILLKDN